MTRWWWLGVTTKSEAGTLQHPWAASDPSGLDLLSPPTTSQRWLGVDDGGKDSQMFSIHWRELWAMKNFRNSLVEGVEGWRLEYPGHNLVSRWKLPLRRHFLIAPFATLRPDLAGMEQHALEGDQALPTGNIPKSKAVGNVICLRVLRNRRSPNMPFIFRSTFLRLYALFSSLISCAFSYKHFFHCRHVKS